MSEFTNPYRPGEVVTDPAMLFGRQDVADWIGLQVAGNNRTLVLSALPLIGKTSFLKHAGTLQNVQSFNLLISMAELPFARASGRRASPEAPEAQTVNTVLQSAVNQLLPQLRLLDLLESRSIPPLAQSSGLRTLFAQIRQELASDRPLMLYIDDLHLLIGHNLALVASFLTALMPLLDECPALHLVFALNEEKLKKIRHPLIDGAPTFNLGPLPADASISMITLPVKNILRFDYGVVKRIAEVNSHHPYYLSLYCHLLLNRQVHDGWVNQQDFDNILSEILDSPIEPFRQIWDEAGWPERAILAGMAAIQGAHGPITNQEIIRFLQRQNPAVVGDVVLQSLQTLAERGVLIPMGAVSYRFHVELFRFWLRAHTEPRQILTEIDWGRTAAQLRSAVKGDRLSTRPIAPGAPTTAPPHPVRRRALLPWLATLVTIFLCLLILAGGGFVAWLIGIPLPFTAQITPSPIATPAAESDQPEFTPLDSVDEATATPAGPSPTPSPTPALVVARTLPSIVDMGRDVEQNWLIYVMNADGSGVTALSSESADDASPVWSPDGQKIAFVSRRDGNREIYVMDSGGQQVVNVTRHPADDWTPAWSPDGSQLAFSSFRAGSWEIFAIDSACLSEPETCPSRLTQITTDGNGNLSPVWSPDGSRFAFNSKANGNWDIYTMRVDGTDVRQLTTHPENDLAPAWSPDGTQIAFESNRDGNVEIYVIDSGGGVPRNVTNLPLANDHGPTWAPDGQQLVFYSNREGNWDIFTTTVDGGSIINLTQSPGRDEQTPAWRP